MGNDAGIIDIEGNPIETVPGYTTPMITRGSQDSHTSYGKKWSLLRNLPDKFIQDLLESTHRAYFNFEQAAKDWENGGPIFEHVLSDFPKSCVYMRWNYTMAFRQIHKAGC